MKGPVFRVVSTVLLGHLMNNDVFALVCPLQPSWNMNKESLPIIGKVGHRLALRQKAQNPSVDHDNICSFIFSLLFQKCLLDIYDILGTENRSVKFLVLMEFWIVCACVLTLQELHILNKSLPGEFFFCIPDFT